MQLQCEVAEVEGRLTSSEQREAAAEAKLVSERRDGARATIPLLEASGALAHLAVAALEMEQVKAGLGPFGTYPILLRSAPLRSALQCSALLATL